MLSLKVWRMVMAGALGASAALCGAQATVAPTPPMGWNSWDAYGLTISEAQFRGNAAVLKDKLLPFGWRYAVIDEGWYFENPNDRPRPDDLRYAVDPFGRYVPVPARFPSVTDSSKPAPVLPGKYAGPQATLYNTSFAELAKWTHAQGLQFGVHIVRGIPRVSVERNLPIEGSAFHAEDAADRTSSCPWDPTNWGVKDDAAGQAWYDSLMRQYAAWGVDLLKVDCIAENPYRVTEIRMIRRAIDRAGRPMVLSISPGPTLPAHAEEVGQLATMWRISNDIWDYWDNAGKEFPRSVKSQFATTAAWAKYTKPGNWPDADMLPLGELRPAPGWGDPRATRLTADEQRTLLTLWAMARSPLILGANLTLLDDATLRLLTNPDLIEIDQHATSSSEVLHQGELIAWRAQMPDGRQALALFNTGDAALKVARSYAEFGGGLGSRDWQTTDVWTGQKLGRKHGVALELAPHACTLLMLR